MGFRWLSNHSQVDCGLHDHFATIVAHLLPSCITAVAFVFSLFTFPLSMRLYNNAAKIFGAERVLRRRLENLEGKMVYTTHGKCSIYRASRVSVFFLKKVSSREDCAEGYWVYYYNYPIYELSANIIPRGLDGRCNSIVFVLIPGDIRRGEGYLL